MYTSVIKTLYPIEFDTFNEICIDPLFVLIECTKIYNLSTRISKKLIDYRTIIFNITNISFAPREKVKLS